MEHSISFTDGSSWNRQSAYASGRKCHSVIQPKADVYLTTGKDPAEISTNAAYKESLNPYKDGLPKEIDDKLTKRYEDIFRILLKHRDKVDRVTFWRQRRLIVEK